MQTRKRVRLQGTTRRQRKEADGAENHLCTEYVRLLIHGNTWRLAEGTGVEIIKVVEWVAGSEHDHPFRHELVNINNMFRNTRSSVRGLVHAGLEPQQTAEMEADINLTGPVFFLPPAIPGMPRGGTWISEFGGRPQVFQCVERISSGIIIDSSWPIAISTVVSLVWLVDGWGTALEPSI